MYNYYAIFIPHYAHISTLFYNLLQKNIKLDWTTDCDTAFNQFKHALVHAHIFAMLNFDANFVV